MSILTPRATFGPHEYPQFYTFWKKQHAAHWIPDEIPMGGDVDDWKVRMSNVDKEILGATLKGFTATETFVEDYWSSKVARWFKKPEVQMMAHTFGAFESIHAAAYSLLEETLGVQDYESFLKEPTAKAKIDRLIEQPGKTRKDIALSLAVFSAFTEGVNLFSSFAVLGSFQQRDLMKGVGKIIEWSAKDEALHSTAGVELYKVFINEFPDLLTDDFKKEIYDAARLTVQLEDNFIDMAFSKGDLPNLTAKDLKNYIRFRTNSKLQELGLKSNWKNIDKEGLQRLEWFNIMISGETLQDFFAANEASYGKSTVSFEDIWK